MSRTGRGRGRARAEIAVARVLDKRLGALPVVAQFGRRLRIAEVVDYWLRRVEDFSPYFLGNVLPHVAACDDDRLAQGKAFRTPDSFIPRPVELLFDAEDKFVELL